MNLRPYQLAAMNAVAGAWEEVDSTLIVLPTGTGKTVTFGKIIKERLAHGSALVLAHREELIWQAADKVHQITGVIPDIEMAEHRAQSFSFGDHIVISTVQTQTAGGDNPRFNKFDPNDFATIIIDEAHHAVSKTYRKIIDHYRQNSKCKILGVTATPDRGDGKALKSMFETCAYSYCIVDATRDGWLVPIQQQIVDVASLDFTGIKKTAGDFNGRQLSDLMTYEENLHAIATPSFEIAGDRPTIIFTTSVAHAERLSEILNRHRPGCSEWVCGATPKNERRATLSRYQEGKTQFICNVGVLVEGFDAPHTGCIVVARPTMSRSRYAQMVGRGTRPLPGIVDSPAMDSPESRRDAIASSLKTCCLVVDFCGNAGRHKLVNVVDILGEDASEEVRERAKRYARDKPETVEEMLEKAQEELDAEARERERKEQEFIEKRKRIKAKVSYQKRFVDPFKLTNVVRPGLDVKGGLVATPSQASLLGRNGVDSSSMTEAEAGAMCREIIRRHKIGMCTIKQASLLSRYQMPTNIGKRVATGLIDAIAANGWKKPSDSVIGSICPQAVGKIRRY